SPAARLARDHRFQHPAARVARLHVHGPADATRRAAQPGEDLSRVLPTAAAHLAVQRPGAWTGEEDVEEDEAEEDRRIAAVADREGALRRVGHPVGSRHLS